MSYILYCHTNKINGKKYFGITSTTVNRRWMNGIGYKSSRHFNYAIEKYGWDNFNHEIIAEGLNKEDACALEKEYIQKYNTTNDKYGYNISTGGESGASGVVPSEETLQKRSAKLKGRIHTEETKKKMSESAKGRTFSDETKAKMRMAKLGKPLSEEHKRKMSISQKGRIMSDESKDKIRESKKKYMKKVYCIETNKTYNSIHETARELNLNVTNISNVCKGKHKTTKGYHFNFVD